MPSVSLRCNRRLVLAAAATAAFSGLHPRNGHGDDDFGRSGPPNFRLGLAAYSMRKHFAFMKGKPQRPLDPENVMTMFAFIDYCRSEGFQDAELTSYFFPSELNDDYLLQVKRHAFLQGVSISGTAIGNNFTCGAGKRLDQEIDNAIRWIDRAAVLGAPHIRFFAGTGKQLDEHPERMKEAIASMKRCADHAAEKGIFLGIENHGNLRRQQLLDLIHAVDHPWVGINLDTGNFFSEDPYGDLQACVPYAVNVQVKVTMRRPSGEKYPADFDRIATILRDGSYRGSVVLEYEDEDPFVKVPEYAQKLRQSLAL
ncbi:MAG: sugar phosphate isomerase/epimerase family protein [Planctomycetota bacterium]